MPTHAEPMASYEILDRIDAAVGKLEPLTPEQTAAAERVVRRHVPDEDVAGVLMLLGLT